MSTPDSVSKQDLMRYLDGELAPEERQRVEDALSGSEELRRQLDAFRALRADLHGLTFAEGPCEGTVWHRVAAQVARPAGRTFALVGLAAWLAYATWVLSTGTPDPWDRIAVAGISIGVLALLAAVIRDRFRSWSEDT